MPPAVTTVFADDLTGACEIAGMAHRHGLRAVVALAPDLTPAAVDLLVVDTETRLCSSHEAAQCVSQWLAQPGIRDRAGRIFKKIDSVLRGPIAAEVSTLAKHIGNPRILLVPGNPALGRVVRNGEYFINDLPLNQTTFNSDPHHPAMSSSVRELIGPIPEYPMTVLHVDDPLPEMGLMVANVGAGNDLATWAARLPADALAVGSSVFFDALLRVTGRSIQPRASAPTPPGQKLLLISGTTDPTQQAALRRLGQRGLTLTEIPADRARCTHDTHADFGVGPQAGARAAIHGPARLDPDPSAAHHIRQALAGAARSAVDFHGVKHLVIEGGATAAAIADSFSWSSFEVTFEWAPGVVSVCPNGSADVAVTLKPGSYPWPPALLKLIDPDTLPTP